MLIKLFKSEIKFILKLQIGQILATACQNLIHMEFEHAFKPHLNQIF